MDYTQITDKIFIGSDLCQGMSCAIHGKEFEDLGILVEINMSVEKKETPPDGIDIYTWLPVADYYPPSKEQFDIGTSIINEAVTNGKKVYVHCKNGHGRSPSLVAAYFMRYQKMTPDEAISLISSKRPEVHLGERQIEGLKEFEKRMR